MEISVSNARTNFARLLDEVEEGRTVTITRRGEPVARLVPVSRPKREHVREVIEELRAFRRGRRLENVTLGELIEEGRRY